MSTERKEFSIAMVMPTPVGPQFHLDLITPPSSDESARPAERHKTETPRSHRTSSLNKEFRKCSIFCDEATGLTPIKEEDEKGLRVINCNTVFSLTPEEHNSPRKLQKRSNSIQASDKAELHYYEAIKKRTIEFCESSDEESKENSPIKISTNSGICWTLQPPPRKLNTLTSGTNGRKDILLHLYKKNLYFVLQKIISYLDPLDLIAMKNVSVSWKDVVTLIAPHELELAQIMAVCRRENLPSSKKVMVISKSRNERTPLKTMNEISPSPKRRIPLSPELSPVSKRICHYLRDGNELRENERMERCPKCRYPARIVEALAASCTRCRYTFCSRCRHEPHPNESCKLMLSPNTVCSSVSVKLAPIGSKQSKKALTRLL